MASIKKDYNSMGLPMNINRSNPIPVDCTELWYSLEDAQNYAQNDPRAYVGQSIKVIDESTGDVSCYVIGIDGSLLSQAQGDSEHNYDDRYYTEVEIDTKFENLDNRYYTETEIDTEFERLVGETSVQTQISDALNNIEGIQKTFYVIVDEDGIADKTGVEFARLFGYENGWTPIVKQKVRVPKFDETGNEVLYWIFEKEYEYVGTDIHENNAAHIFSRVENNTIYTCKITEAFIDNNNPVTCTFSSVNIEEMIDEKKQSYFITIENGIPDRTNGDLLSVLFLGSVENNLMVKEILPQTQVDESMTLYPSRIYEFVGIDIPNSSTFVLSFSCVKENIIYNCEVTIILGNDVKDELVSVVFTTKDLDMLEAGSGEGIQEVFVQIDEPIEAPNGSVWIDIDASGEGLGGVSTGSVPSATLDDNDKILQVVNGEYMLVTIENSAVKTYIDNYINEALGGEF